MLTLTSLHTYPVITHKQRCIDWTENICDNVLTGVCSLDIKKCFDTIDHSILLSKLSNYGVNARQLKWFDSYLTGRKQVVKCNAVISSSAPVAIGVPQGSSLGPLLFLVFINDISQHVFDGVSRYSDQN